ncbi:hypothetical protein FNT36_14345 [Hymenobacter setariae]|uniref:Uncharacterized protein n=1 Tax=Hymenobacter setariae TaxID=2594794 RepID=A0A558BVU9_9BACT|nr:hypothetical protein [Hymenobacter setariae]TVT40645.1 hypothetical protein FNT36_14345 [Hymenobacter setariae]
MKSPLTITWQSYDSITPDTPGFNLEDFGEPYGIDTNWPAYLAQYPTEWHAHLEAIRQAIVENEVWAGGDWHQYSPNGVPVLSDGHFMTCTWRSWGGMLAAIWNSELGQRFTYMDFYMEGRLPPRPEKR